MPRVNHVALVRPGAQRCVYFRQLLRAYVRRLPLLIGCEAFKP